MKFNSDTFILTLVYISILTLILVIAFIGLLSHWKQKDRVYYTRFILLLFTGIIYNIVEEMFPSETSIIDMTSQYIISYTVGLATAVYFLFYLSKEYELIFLKKFDVILFGAFSFLILVCSFIIPFTITKSLDISRLFFLVIVSIILSVNIISVIKSQYYKFCSCSKVVSKVHVVNGSIGFISIILFPLTIMITSGNQIIVQTIYTFGFFSVCVDYFLYPLRKKILHQSFPVFSKREKEILSLFLQNHDQRFSELSERIYISEKTFSVHMSSIYKKMNVKGKKDLYKKCKGQNFDQMI